MHIRCGVVGWVSEIIYKIQYNFKHPVEQALH